MKYGVALAVLLAGVSSAGAEPQPISNFQLYATGKYDEAIREGLARNDAVGFADAARSELAQAATRGDPCLDCLERAEDYARRAIAADPKLPDGQVYLAISLGMEEHIKGPTVARLENYPDRAKHALDAALAADPKNAWALAALGGWNLAIVHGGGSVLADLFYGATLQKGLDAFAAAFKVGTDNIPVRYQYALSLSVYDEDRFHSEIEDALTRATEGTPSTAYDRMVQRRAIDLLDLFKKGDREAYLARVKKYEGYP